MRWRGCSSPRSTSSSGLIIGVAIHGVDFGAAFNSYTILTVGDGLVSQIPALIVSTAAGLLVSKGGMSGRAGTALADQLGRFPKAFGMTAVLLGTLALLPGLPFVPFALMSGAAGWAARELGQRAEARAIAKHAEEAAASAPPLVTEEPIAETLAIDPVRVEIGYALLPLVNESGAEQRLDDQGARTAAADGARFRLCAAPRPHPRQYGAGRERLCHHP
jgi:flagellar biosynthesis protein FlhA